MTPISLMQKTSKRQQIQDYIEFVSEPIWREFFMLGKIKMVRDFNKEKINGNKI